MGGGFPGIRELRLENAKVEGVFYEHGHPDRMAEARSTSPA